MTIIIAEAGTNYAADKTVNRLNAAMRYVHEAAYAGADYVKFQMFSGAPLFCPNHNDDKRWPRWERCVLPWDGWRKVERACTDYGVGFLASVFDDDALEFYESLHPDYYKVATRAVETFPYLEVPGPFLISGGGTGKPLPDNKFDLYCVSLYPCPLQFAFPSSDYALWDGLSDHSGTVWPGLHAIFHRAKFLEMHFAIDKNDAGPDASVCLSCDQLEFLCEARDAFAVSGKNRSL